MKISSTLLTCALSTTALISLGAGAPAWAQSTTDGAPGAPPVTGDAGKADTSRDIIVTGSRIRTGYQAPTPVTVASTAQLAQAAPTNLSDALNQLPQFSGSDSPSKNQSSGIQNTHGNVLNLRNVGGVRTLILFDGRRVPPTTYRGLVDVSTLPEMLVQRVEVVTGGVSAVYGSDGVSGAVNYVLDSNFTGVKGIAQSGISSRGDGGSYKLGIAAGTAFAGGRGHVLFSAMRTQTDEVRRRDRIYGLDYYLFVGAHPNPLIPPGTAANPFVARSHVAYNLFNGSGRFYDIGLPFPPIGRQFTPDGKSTIPWDPGEYTGPGITQIGGSGGVDSDDDSLIDGTVNDQIFGKLSYDITNSITAYAQGTYADSKATFHSSSSAIVVQQIFAGNAYLPPLEQAEITLGQGFGIPFLYSKQFPELPPYSSKQMTHMVNVTAGVKGDLGGGWNFDAYYTYGRTKQDAVQDGEFEMRNMLAALDAVDQGQFTTGVANGNIVCRVTLTNPSLAPGCVPLNAFGVGNASAAALKYISGSSQFSVVNQTHDLAFSVQGKPFSTWAGSVSVSVGAEYRKASMVLTSNSDPGVPINYGNFDSAGNPTNTGIRFLGYQSPTTPTPLRFFVANTGTANGRNDVKEVFGEVLVPLAESVPFARSLEVTGAVRYTDYSTSGGVTTWKLGGSWQPIDGLRFRVTRSRDIRAPTLFDLFAGRQTSLGQPNDPVSGSSGLLLLVSGGNPALTPEIGNTLTGGIVLQPHALPGFALSIDAYKLDISDAIVTLGMTTILQDCFASGGSNPTCALIDRPTPTSFPTQVRSLPINSASIATRGLDIEASYTSSLGGGRLFLRTLANYVDRYTTQLSATTPVVSVAGTTDDTGSSGGIPRWRITGSATYTVNGFTAFVQERFIDSLKTGPSFVYVNPRLPSVFYTDATVSFRIPSRPSRAIEVFATVNNLFDRKPPLFPSSTNPGVVYPTLQGVYDVMGRYITVGAKVKF